VERSSNGTPPPFSARLLDTDIREGAVGVIDSSFGKTGKFKIHFPDGGQKDALGGIVMKFKAYIFQKDKKAFVQS